MSPFDPDMFPSEVVVHVGGYSAGSHGGVVPDYTDAGTTLSCYYEFTSRDVQRNEEGQPTGMKRVWVFTETDPGAVVDSHLLVDGRTFKALGTAHDCSGAGVLWQTECEEIC